MLFIFFFFFSDFGTIALNVLKTLVKPLIRTCFWSIMVIWWWKVERINHRVVQSGREYVKMI